MQPSQATMTTGSYTLTVPPPSIWLFTPHSTSPSPTNNVPPPLSQPNHPSNTSMHTDPAMPVEDKPQAMQPTAATMDDQPQVNPTPGNIPQPATTDAQFAVNGIYTQPNGLRQTVAPAGGFLVPQLGESVWQKPPSEDKATVAWEAWPQTMGETAPCWVH
jgi:hypothetical protein